GSVPRLRSDMSAFCRILPGIRALFEARPAAKYRVPSEPRAGGMMPLRCATLRHASKRRPWTSGLADFLTPLEASGPARPGLTQSFKHQPFQALRLRSVLAGRTPPPI